MNPHDMLHVLQQIEERLPSMLHHPFTEWQTADLDSEQPRIERVWTAVEQFRVCLDRLHPSVSAPLHRHAWPSAVHILSGRSELTIAYGQGPTPPPAAARLVLREGARYEMTHKESWHAMRSLNGPVLSLVVMGPSWEHAATPSPKPLTDECRDAILGLFREHYRALR